MTDLFQREAKAIPSGPVSCLGLEFSSDEERLNYFTEKLREKLKDPEFRKIEGFPIGTDEDILALSDPPYYTACPNPFISEIVQHASHLFDPHIQYDRQPFSADVSEGKNDPIYNAHAYHTKVPHQAIMRYILHYTEPGDVILDGFCGSGMTGVAARLCGDRDAVASLGYKVEGERIFRETSDERNITTWEPFTRVGARTAILVDLSPAATFIAHNLNAPKDTGSFVERADRMLEDVQAECGWMYETKHNDDRSKGCITTTVWSDVFVCSECTKEVVFWEAAVDQDAGTVAEIFTCPHCSARLTKRGMERAWTTVFDKSIGESVRKAKQVPVRICYMVSKHRYEKSPDRFDLAIIDKVESNDIPYWYPTQRLFMGGETRRNDSIGITHVHHFYSQRNLWILSALRERCKNESPLLLLFTSQLINLSRLNRYRPGVSFPYNPLSGTLYVGSQTAESNPFIAYQNKARKMAVAFDKISSFNYVECRSSTSLGISDQTCDYIFTDPPFGGNLAYAELSVLWEEWLRVTTNRVHEAIENDHQQKGLSEYQALMSQCFQEYYRVLKPGRWMTVEFHNSKNSVWNAIQEALQFAGFVIADVRTLDKRTGTFKQVTSGGAVKQDLIISAYRPNGGLEDRFRLEAGTEEGVWDFVRTHLKQLPVFVRKDGQAEVIAERQHYLLFDRMLAFHVQRGVTIPLSATEYYKGLEQRFPMRDGMYFLPDQAAEYDRKRMSVSDVLQLQLFVTDESSAIQWLKQQLLKKPQTFQELHPQFIKEIGGWQKHEKPLELLDLLGQNFLRYNGTGEVPSQIHSYLSTNFKELRSLAKDNATLRAKAKDRWYVPDPNKAGDLEKLRDRTLLREFWEYLPSGYKPIETQSLEGFIPGLEPKAPAVPKSKKMKVIRLEAVRAGFKYCWQNRDYRTIIAVAQRIPEDVLQEDPKLLMWYDQAVTRTGEQ